MSGLKQGYALAGDACPFEAADELFGFAENMGPVMTSMRPGVGQLVIRSWYRGWMVDFSSIFFCGGGEAFLQGGFEEKHVFCGWFFVVSLWFLDGETW